MVHSYLTDRYWSIKIGSTLSDVCKLLFGIPKVLSFAVLIVHNPLSLVIGKHNRIFNFIFMQMTAKCMCIFP